MPLLFSGNRSYPGHPGVEIRFSACEQPGLLYTHGASAFSKARSPGIHSSSNAWLDFFIDSKIAIPGLIAAMGLLLAYKLKNSWKKPQSTADVLKEIANELQKTEESPSRTETPDSSISVNSTGTVIRSKTEELLDEYNVIGERDLQESPRIGDRPTPL